ncbi:Gfo/Idh/MocA family protein [Larkinella rosea]|uniref:Gfo/Idh/MocA family oxidoreductase n=1 Tax=Larkinella rosea TaxID=2025312 RepID=A0A3P1BZT9_9BACT|nr:Gfo/Idh/MocA family oxidoreductase [Larkinella rosea]RRB06449.1 gfo/Idh/MocA family oxidoreductase [Larkinella rosea]
MSKFKAALIGGGSIADKNHIPALKHLSEQVEIVAVCSRDAAKARALADQHSIPFAYSDAGEMYRECHPNLVVICTPNNLHYPFAMQALEQGCHVFCEKPPAIRASEAREMAELAAKKGLVLAYNLQLRQTSEWELLMKCKASGQLGEIYHIKANFLRRRGIPGWGYFTNKEMQGGGALMDLGVHVLDLALCALDYAVPTGILANTYDFIGKTGGKGLMGSWDPQKFEVEDAAMAYLSFATNASIMLSASFALNTQTDIDRNLEVFGSRGGAKLFPLSLYTEVAGELADVNFPYLEAVDIQLKNTSAFVDACLGKPSNVCTAEQGAVLQEVVERIYLSAIR